VLAVLGAESELRRGTENGAGSGARGLPQMMGDTLWRLGWRVGSPAFEAADGDFRRAPVRVQLDFAFRYFADWRHRFGLRRWESFTQLYLANFLPTEIPHAHDGSYLLAGQGKRPKVYLQNVGLDRNHDGRIEVREAEAFVLAAIRGRAKERYETALRGLRRAKERAQPRLPFGARLTGEYPRLASALDVRGVQLALLARGYGVGPRGADGLWSPSTRDAVRAFQVK